MTLFDATTLCNMAQKINNTIAIAPIDWDKEASLELDIEVATEAKKTGDDVTVVRTGATGYLGRDIVKFVSHDRVSKVICVAFRGNEPETFIAQYQDSQTKIEVLQGGLGAPLLGLDEVTFENLGKEADVIVHSGANRSFWDYYQTLSGPTSPLLVHLSDWPPSARFPSTSSPAVVLSPRTNPMRQLPAPPPTTESFLLWTAPTVISPPNGRPRLTSSKLARNSVCQHSSTD